MTAVIKRTVSWLAVLTSILFMGYALHISGNPEANYRTLRHFWNNMGFLSIFLAMLAVGLWLAKKVMLDNKKTRPEAQVSSNTIVLLRQTHMLFGWLSFVLGLGHSIFYLLGQESRVKYINTGLAATFVMVLLIYVGVMYQYKAIKIPIARRLHLILSVLLGFILLLHM